MIRPSWPAVFALKFLQKSMMLTPWGPSAVPTGGAGVALPAAIWSLTWACTFFAIRLSVCLPAAREPPVCLELLDLQEIQFDRRRAAENRDHHLEGALLGVHFVDEAVEVRERPLVDAHLIALFEAVLRLRLLRRDGHLQEDLIDLLTGERRRLGAGPDEAGHLRRVLHDVPRLVGHVHLDEQVAGEEALRADDLAAAAHLDHVLGRNQDLAELVAEAVGLDALLERLLHLLLEPRVGVHDEPLLGHDIRHAAPSALNAQATARANSTSSPHR